MAKQVDNTNIGTLLEALITKIKSFFWRKDETSQLPIDNTPTSGSDNLVKSGGVYTALAGKYTKPSGGIPASDLASGVIPDVSQFITKSVNDLTNYYLKSETYTQTEVNNLIGAIQQFHYEIAASTSAVTNPQSNVLYLIGPTGSGADKYEEYVYDATKTVAERWVKIGDTSIDLSNYVTLGALNDALADTVAGLATVARSGSYNDLLNKPTIPPADYVAMIDFTSSVDGSGIQYTATIVSGTFAEIDAALLAQKTVLVIGRYPGNPVSYQYFRCGEHRPTAEIVFTSTGGGEWFRGMVTAATWYPAANGEPERVLVDDATGILGFSPTGDGNAVTSIEKNPLFPLAVVNKGKTFVDTAEQSLTDTQKSQARTNIGAGTYSKPSGGIPASDLAAGVIPDVSQFITKSVNDLVNYYKKTETYTKTEVDNLIGAIQQFHYEIAASTSAVTDPSNNVLYLIGPTGSGSDKYEEYVYSGGWVKIGDTSIDLSGYVTTQALNTVLAGYVTSGALETALTGKADKSDTYTKQQVDTALSQKANAADIPTKTSDLQNDSGFVTGQEMSQTYETKADAISKESALQTSINGKQDNINDLQTIRDGAAAGATAYQKPSTGIPANDLAQGVIPTVPTDMVKYTAQTLTDAQKAQARTNIGAGSYSKPSGGIPASDIASGVIPAAPVNADWNASSGLAQILNKPTIPAAQVNSDWNATSGLAQILNKPTIPAAQVPSDWNATEGVSRILNKPTVPTQYAGSPTAGGFANKAVAIPFGSVDADSTATDIKATVDNFPTTLTDGVCAYIRNDVVASASGFTLNINGTGAKPVYQTLADAGRVTTVFNAASTYLFIYNSTRVEGGCWDLYYGYNTNDNTIGYNLRTNGASAPHAAQKYYRYRLLFTAANGQSLVPANTSSSTSATAAKTVNQTKIDPFGVIFYYSYTSAVNAGSSPNASYLWMQYNGIALGYSFNRTGAALEMTARDPVYLKCAPQSDGSAIIDADNPFVQALPTTADGKIYIFLGFAESAAAITLYYWHPVYYHDGTSVRLWTGIGIDTTPTQDSTNLVTSGGVYTAIQNAGGGGGAETDEYLSKYFTIEALSSGTIEWRTVASMLIGAARVSYRINGGTWVENVYPYKSTVNADAVIFVSQGDRVEFKGTNVSIGSHMPANRSYFAGTARFKVYGNIMSLIGGDNFVGLKELPHATISEVRTFAGLFQDNTGVVDASNLRLPATTLSDSCYYQMFKGCTSLISAPTLPATTLTSQCYYGMFDGCIALTNAPALLATTLASNCYSYMFRGCTALTDAPSLRAVTLASSCYHYMFYGCTNLNYVIALFTDTPGSNYTDSWLDGVSATGTFVKNSSATWDVSGSSGIPSGWTVETTSR